MTETNNALNNSASADFTISTATAGTDRKAAITNTDNTSGSSSAHLQVTAGGASGGDPYLNFLVTGAGTFSLGIDNSDSDILKLTSGANPGDGASLLQITSSGNITSSATVYNQAFSSPADGYIDVFNSNGGAAANSAVITRSTDGGGDSSLNVCVYNSGTSTRTTEFCLGIDNSDSDKLKINVQAGAASATILDPSTGTNVMTILTSGEITQPLQVAFSACNAVDNADVTGDGTAYTVPFATEIFDQNADFATPTFTAPVTGRYMLSATILLQDLTAAHTSNLRISTSNRLYDSFICKIGVIAEATEAVAMVDSGARMIDMDAGDTATIIMTVSAGAKVVDVAGLSTFMHTQFSGFLAC